MTLSARQNGNHQPVPEGLKHFHHFILDYFTLAFFCSITSIFIGLFFLGIKIGSKKERRLVIIGFLFNLYFLTSLFVDAFGIFAWMVD